MAAGMKRASVCVCHVIVDDSAELGLLNIARRWWAVGMHGGFDGGCDGGRISGKLLQAVLMSVLVLACGSKLVRVLDYTLPDKEAGAGIVCLGRTKTALSLRAVKRCRSVQFLEAIGGTSVPNQPENVTVAVSLGAVALERSARRIYGVDKTKAIGGQTVVLGHRDAAARSRPVVKHGQTLAVGFVCRVEEVLEGLLLNFIIAHQVPAFFHYIGRLGEVIHLELDGVNGGCVA